MLRFFSLIKHLALDLILPVECFNCSQPGEYFCANCQKQLELNNLDNSRSLSRHLKCPELDKIFIAGDYDQALLQELIIKYKYHFISSLDNALGNFLINFWLNNIKPDIINNQHLLIIPLPLSKKRLRWRGFNQAANLSEKFSKHFNYKLFANLKRRHRKPQAELNEIKRQKNISAAFYWDGDNLDGQTVILIDDVVTTGSTINEAAKTLKKVGAGEVWGLLLAKG